MDNLQITILVFAVVLVGLLVANFFLLNRISALLTKMTPNQVKHSEKDEGFSAEWADRLLEKGKFKELVRYCESLYKEYPHSTQVNWYYALSYYNLGEFELAKSYFTKVVKINPLWQDGANAYLHEMDKMAQSTDVHSDTLH